MREVKQPIIYIVMLLFIACQNVEKNKDLGKESKQNLGMLDARSRGEILDQLGLRHHTTNYQRHIAPLNRVY